MLSFPTSLRPAALALLLAAPASAATTITVHNLTGRTLSVLRTWSPWHPEPCDGPQAFPAFQHRIAPGGSATYRFLVPGRDLDTDLVIRRLGADETVVHDGLTLRATDPDLEPPLPCPMPGPLPPWARIIGEQPPPEPGAPAVSAGSR